MVRLCIIPASCHEEMAGQDTLFIVQDKMIKKKRKKEKKTQNKRCLENKLGCVIGCQY